MINLGDKVKDTITDFEGTAVAKIIYLNGCIRYEVKPKGLEDGKIIESEWIECHIIERTREGDRVIFFALFFI